MEIKLHKIETFGEGVKAFRLEPVADHAPAAEAKAAPAAPVVVTEGAMRFGEYLRAQFLPSQAAS